MIQGIAAGVTSWVGGLLGVPTSFGEFPRSDADCAMVKASPGDPVVRRYAAGGGLYRFGYEVYLRALPRTEGERVEALELLGRIVSAIEARAAPDVEGAVWASHECTMLPSIFRVESNGVAVYQAAAYLTYIERS